MPREAKAWQQVPHANHPVTIWFHLSLPMTSKMPCLPRTPTSDEWMSILHIPRGQHGWRHTHWGLCLEDPRKAWLVLEWNTMADLDNFKTNEAYTAFWDGLITLVGATPSVYHLYHIGHRMLSGFFRRTIWPGSHARHEVLTAYFPKDMGPELKHSVATRLRLDSMSLRLAMLKTCGDPALVLRANALENQDMEWVEDKVMWKGKPAEAYMVLFRWGSEDGERLWKQEERGPRRHLKDGELPLAIDSFFEIMKEHGMLGFESYHGEFVGI